MAHLVFFISPHGFGHAARSCAVINELATLAPQTYVTIFTTVPPWFFEDSLTCAHSVEPVDTDLGMVQRDAFREDLPATLEALQGRVPFPAQTIDTLATRVTALGADLVVCDIAPLGLAVADASGLRSVLIENFTWDWIYRGYLDECPALASVADTLAETFSLATHHVQTEPACQLSPHAHLVPPVSRSPRTPRDEVRRALGVPAEAPMLVVTMGGVGWRQDTLHTGLGRDDPWLVVPGSPRQAREGHLIRLPARSEFYHPDLIHAADGVVGKLGYSTVAEVAAAGVPFAYVARPDFPESAPLEAWVQRELSSRQLTLDELANGDWLGAVQELLGAARALKARPNGARAVARLLTNIIE